MSKINNCHWWKKVTKCTFSVSMFQVVITNLVFRCLLFGILLTNSITYGSGYLLSVFNGLDTTAVQHAAFEKQEQITVF